VTLSAQTVTITRGADRHQEVHERALPTGRYAITIGWPFE
jgi:hypothetical protein